MSTCLDPVEVFVPAFGMFNTVVHEHIREEFVAVFAYKCVSVGQPTEVARVSLLSFPIK